MVFHRERSQWCLRKRKCTTGEKSHRTHWQECRLCVMHLLPPRCYYYLGTQPGVMVCQLFPRCPYWHPSAAPWHLGGTLGEGRGRQQSACGCMWSGGEHDRRHSRADIRRTDAHQLCCQDRSCTSKQIVLGVKWLHIPKQGRLWHRLVDGKYGLEQCREKGRLLSLVYLLWGGESCRWSVKAASSSAHFCKDYKIINKDSEHVHLKPETSLLRKKTSEMIQKWFVSVPLISLAFRHRS